MKLLTVIVPVIIATILLLASRPVEAKKLLKGGGLLIGALGLGLGSGIALGGFGSGHGGGYGGGYGGHGGGGYGGYGHGYYGRRR